MGTNKRTRQKLVKLYSCFNEGTYGILSEIEVSITPGIPTFEVIGLCDSVIRESRGRIQAALISSGFSMPRGHIVVSISPAYLHKSGSYFDLPIALGMLMASDQLPAIKEKKVYAEGELSLTGFINGTPGAAARLNALYKSQESFDMVFIPEKESDSAAITGVEGYFLSSLSDFTEVSEGSIKPRRITCREEIQTGLYDLDFSSVKGQPKAMRAITIAACGFHSILLLGSPGCGKTTVGNVVRGLLPSMDQKEMADVYTVKEVAGIGNGDGKALSLTSQRPLRRIYPASTISKVLGSSRNGTPGELVLANHGVLLADEICEFPSGVIDSLRLPLEERVVRIQKDGKDLIMPAEFLFVGLGNPCRCGMYFENGSKCTCSPQVRKRYVNKLSGPFGDRIDLYSEMRSVGKGNLVKLSSEHNESLNIKYRKLVKRTWDIQKERYKDSDIRFNGTIDKVDQDLMRLSNDVQLYAADICEKSGFSARGYTKLIKVGRTIADMEQRPDITKEDILEAATYRLR